MGNVLESPSGRRIPLGPFWVTVELLTGLKGKVPEDSPLWALPFLNDEPVSASDWTALQAAVQDALDATGLPTPLRDLLREIGGRALREVTDAEGHEHAPAGSSEGGQFVSKGQGGGGGGEGEASLPKIEGNNAFARLVEIEIREAKLPASHYDGLEQIKFNTGDWIHTQATWSGGRVIEAAGTYNPSTREITLAANAPGGGNVTVFGGKTILHEIGHHVHLAKLTAQAADEWADYSNNGETARISAYARTNTGEHFAEAYRAYTSGANKRSALKNLEPRAYTFMQKLMKANSSSLLAKGERSNQSWQTRYSGGHSTFYGHRYVKGA